MVIVLKARILDILKKRGGYVSGEEISRELSVSRSAVWKHIRALRNEGYRISSVTNKGYRLEKCDVLNQAEIFAALHTEFIGQSLFCLEKTDSTNNECKRHSDLPDGTVFASEVQTGGKGRRGKNWASPRGVGAWFSILLKPELRPEEVPRITLIAGLAVCRAIGDSAMIKYPNDVVIGTKKVCGILTELSAEMDFVNYIVCGIGINVNTPSFEGELSERATSLLIETGQTYSRARLIGAVLTEFEALYRDFLQNGLSGMMEEYRSRCITLGSEVTVTYNKQSVRGKCTDIREDGSIVIRTEDGDLTISSGEVSVRGIYGYV